MDSLYSYRSSTPLGLEFKNKQKKVHNKVSFEKISKPPFGRSKQTLLSFQGGFNLGEVTKNFKRALYEVKEVDPKKVFSEYKDFIGEPEQKAVENAIKSLNGQKIIEKDSFQNEFKKLLLAPFTGTVKLVKYLAADKQVKAQIKEEKTNKAILDSLLSFPKAVDSKIEKKISDAIEKQYKDSKTGLWTKTKKELKKLKDDLRVSKFNDFKKEIMKNGEIKFGALGKVFKSAKANYSSIMQTYSITALASGICAYYCASDMYNLTMTITNDKEKAKKEGMTRFKQEIAKAGINTYLTYLVMGLFKKSCHSTLGTMGVFLGLRSMSEVLCRMAVGKPVLPVLGANKSDQDEKISPKEITAEEMKKKLLREEFNKNLKKAKK